MDAATGTTGAPATEDAWQLQGGVANTTLVVVPATSAGHRPTQPTNDLNILPSPTRWLDDMFVHLLACLP